MKAFTLRHVEDAPILAALRVDSWSIGRNCRWGLRYDVEFSLACLTLAVRHPPQMHPSAVDGNKHLVQVPATIGPRSKAP